MDVTPNNALKKIAFFLALILISNSCNLFSITKTYDVINLTGKKISLVFSHNINGETHPCGCRKFPLGGLPQFAGLMHKIKKEADVIYVDTGDTFFPSSRIPKSVTDSLSFAATNLAIGLDMMHLKYYVPGDQDMALGTKFLADLVKKSKFQFLIANLATDSELAAKKWSFIERGPHKIFMLGLVNPQSMPAGFQNQFSDPQAQVKLVLSEIKSQAGYTAENPFHRIVVLSHGGINFDKKIAESFPQIDWIIGSHTQSFLRKPTIVGNTKLVQVLSRNHYIGEIKFSIQHDKSRDTYQIHEMRDELKDLHPNNPFNKFILDHKAQLTKVQLKEQEKLVYQSNNKDFKLNTAGACMECHEAQTDKWMSTVHSIALGTLIQAKAQSNLDCLKCHTYGQMQQGGYLKASDLVLFQKDENANGKDANKLKSAKYWQEIEKIFKSQKSLRKLSKKKIRKISNQWMNLDLKMKVSTNFANVQCSNCHNQHIDHPFDSIDQTVETTRAQRLVTAQKTCVKCHNPDQSPEWYQKDNPLVPMTKMIEKLVEKIACPMLE